MFDQELNIEATNVAKSYEEKFGIFREAMCEQPTTEFGIDRATNRGESVWVDPKIEITNIKFDEEKLIGDEWLQMMQQK